MDHAPVVASLERRHLHDPHRGSFFSKGEKKKRDRFFRKESMDGCRRMGVDGTDPTCSGNKVETYGIEKSSPCIDVSRAFHPLSFVCPFIKKLHGTGSANAYQNLADEQRILTPNAPLPTVEKFRFDRDPPFGSHVFLRKEMQCCKKDCRFPTTWQGIQLDAHQSIATFVVSHVQMHPSSFAILSAERHSFHKDVLHGILSTSPFHFDQFSSTFESLGTNA